MTKETGTIVHNGIKIASEVIVSPGGSLLLEGKVSSGVMHMAGGILSRVLLGPVAGTAACIGLALNSYAKSINDRNIFQQFKGTSALPAAQAEYEDTP